MHGPTFMGNPLAAAVALASVGCCWTGTGGRRWRVSSRRCGPGWRRCGAARGCGDVRVLGAVGVVQLDHGVDLAAATAAAVEAGVWLRPFRDLVYTMPPYICAPADLATITAAVRAAVAAG